MPRKLAADLVLGGPRVRRTEPADTTGTLAWHHTEFGRRTDCETYRIVHKAAGWLLLDAEWNPIGDPVPTIPIAQQLAERHARSAKAVAERSTGNPPPRGGLAETYGGD